MIVLSFWQGLTLSYSFSATEEGADRAAVIGSVDSEQPWEDSKEETAAAEGVGPLVVEKFDLTLEGGARKSVTIKMRAVTEGWVCVTGLRYSAPDLTVLNGAGVRLANARIHHHVLPR